MGKRARHMKRPSAKRLAMTVVPVVLVLGAGSYAIASSASSNPKARVVSVDQANGSTTTEAPQVEGLTLLNTTTSVDKANTTSTVAPSRSGQTTLTSVIVGGDPTTSISSTTTTTKSATSTTATTSLSATTTTIASNTTTSAGPTVTVEPTTFPTGPPTHTPPVGDTILGVSPTGH